MDDETVNNGDSEEDDPPLGDSATTEALMEAETGHLRYPRPDRAVLVHAAVIAVTHLPSEIVDLITVFADHLEGISTFIWETPTLDLTSSKRTQGCCRFSRTDRSVSTKKAPSCWFRWKHE